MFDRTEIIVGLEIGTAKVCAVVGELSEDEGIIATKKLLEKVGAML